MPTITETLVAWIPQYSGVSLEDLTNPKPGITSGLSFTSATNDMSVHGWTRAGTAEITTTLIDSDALVLNKVASLKAEAAEIRAKAFKRCNEIDGQIQNLMAITYAPAPAKASDDMTDAADDLDIDEDDNTCTTCDGTGEGAYDAASCRSCGGKGEYSCRATGESA